MAVIVLNLCTDFDCIAIFEIQDYHGLAVFLLFVCLFLHHFNYYWLLACQANTVLVLDKKCLTLLL